MIVVIILKLKVRLTSDTIEEESGGRGGSSVHQRTIKQSSLSRAINSQQLYDVGKPFYMDKWVVKTRRFSQCGKCASEDFLCRKESSWIDPACTDDEVPGKGGKSSSGFNAGVHTKETVAFHCFIAKQLFFPHLTALVNKNSVLNVGYS